MTMEESDKVVVYEKGGIEFENYEDYLEYLSYQDQLERQGEEEEWMEEYWMRRRDPCWKNDLDYD
jgi:hypothetical protein